MTKTAYGSFSPVQGDGRKYKRHTKGTYIGLVACVIQDSPDKMLTFKQIMKKLELFVSGDRKGLENNIRVCLSSNKCFVKVPIDPDYPNAKRNFWRVDQRSITPKMLRRHFSDMVELFPGLPPAWIRKPAPPPAPSPPICPVKTTCEDRPIKFTGPFSIDSLLRKDHVSAMGIAVQQPAPTASSTDLRSDQLYSRITSTHSPTGLSQDNGQRSLCYIYRSVEGASWGKPVQRIELSPELHHSLLYSPHLPYDHMLTNIWSSSPNTQLTYSKW
ncbi:Forkhead box protein H1 [Bagarius yarrelli]|uniref:Forkhead box protein H1 n=1 Tax=Bagarius yarrelli TaxID=175774 RepID=A0A556TPK2_BAGYA|nr:Forkhead box protein H1 [Bagarius yarrelli]